MNSVDDQKSAEPGQQADTIEAQVFIPSDGKSQRSRLALWQIILLTFAGVAVAIFWFLFTSKSVLLDFKPAAADVSISGGFAFELGGVYLLREGEYQVVAQAPLHEPLQAPISVGEERNQRIQLEFEPLPGFLTLALSPADATVVVDGQPAAETTRLELAAGLREITVSHPRYIESTVTVDMQGKQIEQSERIELAPNWANVEVMSEPAGASIWIDDQPTDLQTPATIEALAGEREVSVRLDGYKTHRERIFAQAGLALSLAPVQLEQADATVTVTSRPQGAGVTINGRFMGQTPIDLE